MAAIAACGLAGSPQALAEVGAERRPVPPRPAEPVAAAAYGVLETHCARCHQTGRLDRETPAGGFAGVLDLDALARDPTLVQPGNPDASRLYLQMLRRLMPHDVARGVNDKVEPDADEITRVREWIAGLPGVAPVAACASRPRARAGEAAAIARVAAAAGFAASRLRFVSLAHLHDACLPDAHLESFRIALGEALKAIHGSGPVRLEPIDATRTLLRLDLAELGWSAADWDRLIARAPGGRVLERLAGEPARAAFGTPVPVVRGDWLVHTLRQGETGTPGAGGMTAGGAPAPSAPLPPAPAPPAPSTAAVPAPAIDGLPPALALARQFTRPVHLARAAAEIGVPAADLLRLAEAEAGAASLLARRLGLGLVARAEFDAGLAMLADALAPGAGDTVQPVAVTGDVPTVAAARVLPVAIDPGPGLALVSDRIAYRVGDRLRLTIEAGVDCHLTVVSLDRRGRATVLFPSDFEPATLLTAGRQLRLPADNAAYALRLKEPGRERIVALCNTAGPATDGIQHDFERQRFTDLGDYSTFLAQWLTADAERRRREARGIAAPAAPRPRVARWRPPEPPRARPDQVARTAITIVVAP